MTDEPDSGPGPWAPSPRDDENDPWTHPDPIPVEGPPAPPAVAPEPGVAPRADPWTQENPTWTRVPPSRPGTDRPPRTINTGLPASLPASPPGWETGYPDLPPDSAYPTGLRNPGFAPADPAAVLGPPWPALVAQPGYTPPRLITWPIFAGCGLLVTYIVIVIALAAGSSPSASGPASWLVRHSATITALNDDQAALTSGGTSVSAWEKLRTDAEAAAALPNPGGAATVPWREMLNDYVTAATDVVQAEQTHNSSELQAVSQILAAANAAAERFNAAMGTG